MLIDRRSVLIGLGLVGISPLAAHADLEIVEAGEVEAATGTSTGQLRGQKRTLALGAKVFIDDTLGTGAGARLGVKLGEATHLALGERTRVRIDKFLVDRGGNLVLERGAMLFDRPDQPQSGQLNVATPFGLIAARGTKFFAGPSDGSFGVFVEHGLVIVKTRSGQVQLTSGLGTDMRSIKLPPSAPKAWSGERVAQALASVS